MRLAGTFTIGSDKSFVFMKDTKQGKEYSSYTDLVQSDRIRVASGLEPENPRILDVSDLRKNHLEYLIGAMRSSVTGATSSFGNVSGIRQMLDLITFARHYQFSKDDIVVSSITTEFGVETVIFSAADDTLVFKYEQVDGQFTEMYVQYGASTLQLKSVSSVPSLKGLEFSSASDAESLEVFRATAKTIHYADLEQHLDMSWYKENGVVKKRYVPVHTIEEFEAMFSSMMEDACNTNELVVGLDTETTGVTFFDLSKDNPQLDHCVEISVSWKDNEAYCIFTDMEYFESLSAEYCFKRFAEIFTEDDSPRKIVWNGGKRSQVFARTRFHLVGQNFPFDKRVGIVHGSDLWFDDDTLNMGFNIDPKAARGSVKLKNMTRRVFHHETPELTDVLGKGNEDKYRWLEDEEVACIYAGADADYTRQLYFKLREMLGERMYFNYYKQDVWLLNVLARSEYYGLRTQAAEAKKLAKQTEENLKILQDAAYKYVGAYMSYKQQADLIAGQVSSGIITAEEACERLKCIHADPNATFEFEFKGADIRMVMYDMLKYPVYAVTDKGIPKVDKNVRKKLLREKRHDDSKARKLTRSILKYGEDYSVYEKLLKGSEDDKKKAEKMELISMDKFNSKEYPMALIFEQFANLNKEYTSYFKPILEGNLEDKIFKTYSLSRIETRRIMNPSQTMKKDLKKLIIPYSDEHYSLDFDLSQIELRLMYSLSGSTELIEKMKNPESDAHTETAAIVNHVPAYEVTKEQRKGAKGVSFGQPYGLGDGSLCEDIFGDRTKEHMVMTAVIVHAWKKANSKVVDLLERARDQALEPVNLSLEKRNFMDAWQKDPETGEYLLDEDGAKIPTPMGAVYNELGFCRYFDLSEVDQSAEAKRRRKEGKYTAAESTIRRAAGNYPIQSYAAEFFRLILHRFYDRCKLEGISELVIWNMLIHDELLCSVHKSVNPVLMMKIVKESCMITMPGHTKYFVGINIGDNWKETKDDAREAPVIFVDRMIKRWDAGEFREQTWFEHPWEFIGPLRAEYVKDRIHEVLLRLQPDLDSAPINLPSILKRFDNYTVRAYVNDYPRNFDVPKDVSEEIEDDLKYQSVFESWMIDQYGEGKELIDIYGNVKRVFKGNSTQAKVIANKFDEEDDFAGESDDYSDFDFDEGAVVDTYFNETAYLDEVDVDDFQYDQSAWKDAKNVADMTIVESKYKYIKVLNGCVIIPVDNKVQQMYLQNTLKAGKGSLVMFKHSDGTLESWKKLETAADLKEVDDIVSSLMTVKKLNALCIQDRIIFDVKNNSELVKLKKNVQANRGFGYKVFARDATGLTSGIGQVGALTDFATF